MSGDDSITVVEFQRLHAKNISIQNPSTRLSQYEMLGMAVNRVLHAASGDKDLLAQEDRGYRDYLKPLTPRAAKEMVADVRFVVEALAPDRDAAGWPTKAKLRAALSHLVHLSEHGNNHEKGREILGQVFKLLALGEVEPVDSIRNAYITKITNGVTDDELRAYRNVILPNKELVAGEVTTMQEQYIHSLVHNKIGAFQGLVGLMNDGVFKEKVTEPEVRAIHTKLRDILIHQLETAGDRLGRGEAYEPVSKDDIRVALTEFSQALNPESDYAQYLQQIIVKTCEAFHLDIQHVPTQWRQRAETQPRERG